MSPGPGDADETKKLRLERLSLEVDQERVPIFGPGDVPAALIDHLDELRRTLLEELLYARYIPVHEGHRHTYGVLIVPNLPDAHDWTTIDPDTDLANIRPLIDGVRTVLVRAVDGAAALAHIDVSDELKLLNATRTHAGVGVQRLGDGRIKLTSARSVAINDGYDWSVRTQARTVLDNVNEGLQLPATQDLKTRLDHLRTLLELCFHQLSPQGIGATFVLCLEGTVGDLHSEMTDLGIGPAIPINVFETRDHDLLLSLLANIDGACMVETDGTLRLYTSKLKTREEASDVIPPHRGSRHTSAKRFSYTNRKTLVVVVSADGPVTLFSDAAPILRLSEQDDAEKLPWTIRFSANDRQRMTSAKEDRTCERCHRALRIWTVVDPAGGDAIPVSCPVCDSLLNTIEHCVEVRIFPVKPWAEPAS